MHKPQNYRDQFCRLLQRKRLRLAVIAVLFTFLLILGQSGAQLVETWSMFSASSQTTAITPPAFLGAEGFGAVTVGGRGGQVIEVTNLNDSGVGSLRAAIAARGARIVVFRVAGIIMLNSSLEIHHPYITIAGHTAPGALTLRNSAKNGKSPLQIKTHDVVIRYLRSRPGPSPNDSGNIDALAIAGRPGEVYNIMIDHCSLSWATDEVVSTFYDVHDLTIQWSIISEGLDCSTHVEQGEKQCHSMGLLLGSKGAHNITIHHNLLAHNRRRNPLVKNSGTTDIVNNVIYNSGFGEKSFAPTQVMGTYASVAVNYVGNYFRPGINTSTADWLIDTTEEPVQVYATGNQVARSLIQPSSKHWLVHRRHAAPEVTTTSAKIAYQQVLENAGAAYRLNSEGVFVRQRDAIDDRIVSEVMQRRGKIINDPAEIGGWVDSGTKKPVADNDHDGMPDDFEIQNRLNPKRAKDSNADTDADGYTNLEEYLNGMNLVSRLVRNTLSFSKSLANHIGAIWSFVHTYNKSLLL